MRRTLKPAYRLVLLLSTTLVIMGVGNFTSVTEATQPQADFDGNNAADLAIGAATEIMGIPIFVEGQGRPAQGNQFAG